MTVAIECSPASTPADFPWTTEDVQRYLHISRSTLSAWINEGRIPKPQRIGRRLLWDPSVIRALLPGEAP
jgi:hypothetical protein